MSGRRERYGWAAYYTAAYEEERKHNIVLAGKIADAQRRQSDLDDNLNRICASPFWKATAPFRKLYHAVKGDGRQNQDAGRRSEGSSCLARYEEELGRQKNPYGEWIKEENNNGYRNGDAAREGGTPINGWQAIRVSGTDVILLAYGRGMLDESTFDKVKSCFNMNESCLAAYADEDFYWEDLSHRMHPWFKPCYSPDTLLAFNYWGYLLAVKADIVSEALSAEERQGGAAHRKQSVRFYDLCLHIEEAVMRRQRLEGMSMREYICHIDGVLYHHAYEPSGECRRRIEAGETPEERFLGAEKCLREDLEAGRYLVGAGADYRAVREAALERRGIKGSLVSGSDPDLYHILYDTSISGRERCARAQSADRHISPHYVVSVVIPSKDHPEALARCLRTFREKTDYPYYEWIVVDNGSTQDNRAKMEALRQEYGFTYLYEEMPFNFSKMCNMGAREADGDLLLFLNDDVEIIEKSWLRRMAGQALQPHTGAVGAKLWYAGTQNIQHAGVTNMEIGPSHKLVTFPDDKDYYYGHNRVVYDMLGVTAACLMVARGKYEEAGGFDEAMAVAYNDVDFCMKLIEAGYDNVQRNDAVLYHHESLSRGLDEEDGGKWGRLLREKENLYAKHPGMRGRDPFYHRALIDNASDYGCNYKFPYEKHLFTAAVEPLAAELAKKRSGNRLRLTVDRAQIQHKIHADEPDILWVMGWCYVPEADNACYEKRVLLQRVDGMDGAGGMGGVNRKGAGDGSRVDESGAGGHSRADGGGAGYTAVPSNWYRKDVEAILPEECHIGLAGFVLRVLREDLELGTYRIGMLCASEQGGQLLAWSDKTCEV